MDKEDSTSNKDKIVLGITLDHEDGVYRAQRWLKGKVVLSVLDNVVACDSKGLALRLEFIGTEMAWHPRGFLFGDGTNTKEKTVFEDLRVLQEFDDTTNLLVKGMVSYPFSIFLPKTLAPSMEYEEDSARGGGCAIRYNLCASLGFDISVERPVKIVGAPLSSKAYPYWLPPTCMSPRPHGAVDNACLVLCAGVENIHVGKGEKLAFSLSCRNFSRVDLERVDVFLTEEIHWMTPSSLTGHHDKIHTHTLAIIRDVTIDGLVKEHNQTRLRLWNTDTPDEPTQVNNELRAEMTSDIHSQRNRVEILIPSNARDTYDGKKLIQVNHFLKIVLVIRDRPSDPHVLIPIHIMDPPIEAGQHHRRASSKSNLAESMTTVWPEDPMPVPVSYHSDHEGGGTPESSSATFPTIQESPF